MTVQDLVAALVRQNPKDRVKVMVRSSKAHRGVHPGSPFSEIDCEAVVECVSVDNGSRERVVIEAWS